MLELFVLSGPDTGRSCELQPGDVLGRAEGCALRLKDRSISRRHARLEQRGDALLVVDLGSTNGLQLDGERVPEVKLVDFLEFKAGEVLLRARLPEPEAEQVSLLAGEPAPAKDEPAVQFAYGGGAVASSVSEPEPELEIEWDEAEPETPARSAPAGLRDEQRAALLEGLQKQRGGFLSADLAQYPAWIQATLALVVLVLGAGISYAIYLAVVGARS